MEQKINSEVRTPFKVLVLLSCLFGAIASVIFAIFSFMNKSIYYYGQYFYVYPTAAEITYGVLLLIFAALACVAFLILCLVLPKLRGMFGKLGVYVAVMPLYLIEALSLLSMDYSHLSDPSIATTFVFALSVIACGGVGMSLAARGKKIPARILLAIFLAVITAGSILSFSTALRYGSTSSATLVIANIVRLVAVVFAMLVVLRKEPYGQFAPASSKPVRRTDKPQLVLGPKSEKRFRLFVAIAVISGALAALFLGIACFMPVSYMNFGVDRLGYYIEGPVFNSFNFMYGILLIVFCTIGCMMLWLLADVKWPGKFASLGIQIAIMPLYMIEVLSLFGTDYSFRDPVTVVSFILALLVIACGAVAMVMAKMGKHIPTRILSVIFLAIVAAGSILIMSTVTLYQTTAEYKLFALMANIIRLIAVGFGIVSVFCPFPYVRNAAKPEEVPAAEVRKPQPIVQEEAKPESDLRKKLTEAKALFDDGLIDEEEFKALKKRYLESQQ